MSYISSAINVGQPKRHLLTSGWSTFVTSKKLVAGDECIFLRFSFSLYSVPPFNSASVLDIFLIIANILIQAQIMLKWKGGLRGTFEFWTIHSNINLHSCFVCRGENGELRVGVRRTMATQNIASGSVISGHSMKHGILASAFHAISTGTMFTVYYHPW